MLFARMNKEYVNEDELAKKVAFERTISFVNKLYPKESPEAALKPGQLTSQLKYGYESLFESFRSAIEQVLSADYNNELTTQKSYEIVKKYNQMSSYLKNIIGMNQLSPEDEEKIKKNFNDLRGKLDELKKIAVYNNFVDRQDIVDMVNKINETSTTEKDEYKPVPATSPEMVNDIKAKTTAQTEYDYIEAKLPEIVDDIQNPTKVMDANLKKYPEVERNVKSVSDAFNNTFNLSNEIDRIKIHDMYEILKDSYDRMNVFKDTSVNKTSTDIMTYMDSIPQQFADVDQTLQTELDDKFLQQEIGQFCQDKEALEIKADQDTYDSLQPPDPAMVSPDPGKFTQPKPVRTPDIKLAKEPPKPVQPGKPGKPKSKTLKNMRQYEVDVDAYDKEVETYNDDMKTYRNVVQKNATTETKNQNFQAIYDREVEKYKKAEDQHKSEEKDHIRTTDEYNVLEKEYKNAGRELKKAKKSIPIKWQGVYTALMKDIAVKKQEFIDEYTKVKDTFDQDTFVQAYPDDSKADVKDRQKQMLETLDIKALDTVVDTLENIISTPLTRIENSAKDFVKEYIASAESGTAIVPKTGPPKPPRTRIVDQLQPDNASLPQKVVDVQAARAYPTAVAYNKAYKSTFKEKIVPPGKYMKYKNDGIFEK